MKPLVYIAGPYTNPDPVENTHRAITEGLAIRDTYDVGVIIPHVTLAAHLVSPRDLDYWYAFDLDQLSHCDALYRLPGASSGADKEVDYAKGLGMPVFIGPGDRRLLGIWREWWARLAKPSPTLETDWAAHADGRGKVTLRRLQDDGGPSDG